MKVSGVKILGVEIITRIEHTRNYKFSGGQRSRGTRYSRRVSMDLLKMLSII